MQRREDMLPAEPKIEAFLSELAVKGNVAVSTQNQAFNALLFVRTNRICGRVMAQFICLEHWSESTRVPRVNGAGNMSALKRELPEATIARVW
jgi:hypothetical protein